MNKISTKYVFRVIFGVLGAVFLLFLLLFGLMFYMIKHSTAKVEYSSEKVNLTGSNMDAFAPVDEDAIPDSEYWSSLEEAFVHYKKAKQIEGFQWHIDEIIYETESEQYATAYVRCIQDADVEWFVMAKFKIKIIDGEKKYTSLYGTLEEHKRHYNRIFSAKMSVSHSLSCLCIDRNYSVYPGEKRFCWGISDYEKSK